MENLNSTSESEQIRKALLRTQIFCVISSCLSLFLLVGVIVLITTLRPLVAFADEAAPQIAQISVFLEEKGPILNEISEFMTEAEPALGKVSELDIDSLNQALQSMEQLDEEQLNQAVINLNKIVNDLNALSEKIRSIFSF